MANETLTEVRNSFQLLVLGTYVQMANDLELYSRLPSEFIDMWLNKFRTICYLGISNDAAARLLILKLKGDARVFIEGLPADTVNDLTQLQTALIA